MILTVLVLGGLPTIIIGEKGLCGRYCTALLSGGSWRQSVSNFQKFGSSAVRHRAVESRPRQHKKGCNYVTVKYQSPFKGRGTDRKHLTPGEGAGFPVGPDAGAPDSRSTCACVDLLKI